MIQDILLDYYDIVEKMTEKELKDYILELYRIIEAMEERYDTDINYLSAKQILLNFEYGVVKKYKEETYAKN